MKKLLSLLLLLSLFLCGCPAPAPTPTPGPDDDIPILEGAFDYMTSNLSAFLELPESIFSTLSIRVNDIPEVTDEDVMAEFNAFFTNGKYYLPKENDDIVDTDDLLYLSYHGVLLSELEEAAIRGDIPDADCTGMSYSEILALSLGFSGGTTQSVTGITVGSANYIEGFEDGLLGAVVSASGEENPVRLHVTFPTEYGAADLAGQDAIFFCRLSYIGDKSAGLYSKDTITVQRLNELLDLSGERAYPSVDACLAFIRDGLVRSRDNTLYNQKASALYVALAEKATFLGLPDEALAQCVRDFLAREMESFEALYESNPSYYAYLFGDEAPNDALVAAYYGYSRDNYMAEMKADCTDAVKAELCYYYLLRHYEVSLTTEEYEAAREKYIDLYGEGIFEELSEDEITAQFLRDKITEGMLDYLENNGRIDYVTTTL